jgi:hypothetical protein
MRFLASLLLLFLAAGPAGAQVPTAALEALRTSFPADHAALAAAIAGKPPAEARRIAYRRLETFFKSHRAAIAAAPGPALVAIEMRQAAMLRALERQDVSVCAAVGDRGFFSVEALGAAPPPGLDDYGAVLIAAAKAGAGAAASPPAGRDDFLAWLAVAEKIVPDVPVRAMLTDRAVRAASSPDHLCRGAAALHEAVAKLPAPPAERMARTMIEVLLGTPAD